uniref:Zf-RVT domain-containing protein n=1 Tax=Macrostomum lignano TaxID=282301 RepID=A0A1I8FKG9_9PLAT
MSSLHSWTKQPPVFRKQPDECPSCSELVATNDKCVVSGPRRHLYLFEHAKTYFRSERTKQLQIT